MWGCAAFDVQGDESVEDWLWGRVHWELWEVCR